MIKRPLKSVGTESSLHQHEQGSVLVYALIVITFLSGLAAYLQTMSDPMIFQTKDTQQILSTDYLADSMENILSELCEKDTDFSGSKAPTDGKRLLATTINKYNSIRLFRTSSVLIGEATKNSNVSKDEVSPNETWTSFSTNAEYYIQYFNTPKISKKISIEARMLKN